MKYVWIAFVILFAMLPKQGLAQDAASLAWYQCKADTECAFAKNPCTDNMVINSKYLNAYNQMIAKSNLHCDKIDPRLKDAAPGCEGGYCVLRLPYQYKQ